MKPCFSKRKLIAWLALGELDARRAQDLRAHIKTCGGCRHYLEEVSTVGERLATSKTEPEIEASASFHRGLVSKLKAEPTASPWQIRPEWFNWRVAVPALGAAALVIVTLAVFSSRQPGVPPQIGVGPQVVTPPVAKAELSPTVANYQRAVLRSPDELDELLTRQSNRHPSHTPIYTASTFALANAMD